MISGGEIVKARFITISISHYCEKVRWVMDYTGFPYFEEAHVPLFHYLDAFRVAQSRTVPILKTSDQTLTDSTEILQYLAKNYAPANFLYRENQYCDQLEMEEYFDQHLGNSARVISYYYSLQNPALGVNAAVRNTPFLEAFSLPILLPVAVPLLKQLYGINSENLSKSLADTENVFRRVEKILSVSGNYLAGKKPGAADFTFASLALPILLPDFYIQELHHLENLPTEFSELVSKWRERPAGQLAFRMYADRF